jgi:RNA polymerase primary sigma factor
MKDKSAKMQLVKRLIEKGKKNGTLTYKEIMDELEDIDLSPEQIEKIYEVLENMGIDVIGDIQDVEVSEEDLDLSIPEGIAIDDPVRMYLKEIGKVPLLSPDEETDLAQRMSDGDISTPPPC